MKIVIVGAGISGLSAFLFLQKHLCLKSSSSRQHSIKVYEAHDILDSSSEQQSHNDFHTTGEQQDPSAVETGYAIGITKNGLDVLRRLGDDETLYSNVRKRGSQILRWKMSNARGWNLATVSMLPNGKNAVSDSLGLPKASKDYSIMITRRDFWNILRAEAVRQKMDIERKRVKEITIAKSAGEMSVLHFTDGTNAEADLIIGADGLKSSLRRAMFQEDAPRLVAMVEEGWPAWLRSWFFTALKSRITKVDYVTPQYEGLVGVGGFIPSSILHQADHEPGTMDIIFGPDGFFGYGCITSDPGDENKPGSLSSWWSTFASDDPAPYAFKENETPALGGPFNQKRAVKGLMQRHGWWNQPVVQAILRYVEEHGISQIYPTYTSPELPTWQKAGKVVLIGDAAHALQPSSGQGASQGLEDAESLALLLKHYLNKAEATSETSADEKHEAVATALEKFVQFRKPRIHAIYERSQRIAKMKSDMSFIAEMMMYAIIRIMSWFGDSYNEALLGYDLPVEVEKVIQKG